MPRVWLAHTEIVDLKGECYNNGSVKKPNAKVITGSLNNSLLAVF